MSNKSESVHEHVENMHRLDSGSSAPSERVTMTMMIFSLYIALNATIATFDSGYGGTVLLMASFNNAYGPCHELPDPQTGAVVEICQVTALQQSLISLTPLFIAVGSILSGVVGNYFGRRGTIQAGSLAVLRCRGNVGRAAGNFANYMVCKSINGLGQGLLLAGTITWGVESTPPQRRGLLLSIYSIGLALGGTVAAATKKMGSSLLADGE